MKYIFLLFLLSSFTIFAQNTSIDTNTVNNICGIDEFGRTFTTMSGTRENRAVGMFYFIWLGQHAGQMRGIYDNTKILEADGGDGMLNLFNKQGTDISPLDQFHYWGEPLYDYYNSGDDYVIRKHIEMLTVAGIDYLVFDVTNASTYNTIWQKLMQILDEYQQQGWNVPKVAFYTNSYSENTMIHLYNVLYTRNYYPNTWYKPDGKRPLIIGKFDNEPAAGMEQTLRDFFYFRTSQWPDERVHSDGPDSSVFHPDGFPWIDWQKPQRLYSDIINVSVAQHPMLPFSDSYLLGSKNWGRGFEIASTLNDTVPSTGSNNYRYVPGTNRTTRMRMGANFQQEWKLALKADPPNIFVTGWNQWIALKFTIGSGNDERVAFVDSYSEEYSWDIEPMKGGYNDAFFIQLIQNVRKYKGISGTPVVPYEKTIDIEGESTQWDDVKNVYRNIGNKNYGRDYPAFAVTRYTMEAPENNLQEIKVTNDADNIYFCIKSESDITGNTAGISSWMNIFIGTGEVKKQGWEGYNYAINRMRSGDGRASIEMLDSAGTGTETAQEAEYRIQGNIMQVKIPREALSVSDSTFSIYFKVADGVKNPGDIMDYYVTGKSLPMGRLSYVYSNSGITAVPGEKQEAMPGTYMLEQNYPNPFNPSTEIKYSIAEAGKVTLKVYNLLGEEVRSLVNREQEAGNYTVKFDGSGLPSGLYMYRIDSGSYSETKKMILIK